PFMLSLQAVGDGLVLLAREIADGGGAGASIQVAWRESRAREMLLDAMPKGVTSTAIRAELRMRMEDVPGLMSRLGAMRESPRGRWMLPQDPALHPEVRLPAA